MGLTVKDKKGNVIAAALYMFIAAALYVFIGTCLTAQQR